MKNYLVLARTAAHIILLNQLLTSLDNILFHNINQYQYIGLGLYLIRIQATLTFYIVKFILELNYSPLTLFFDFCIAIVSLHFIYNKKSIETLTHSYLFN